MTGRESLIQALRSVVVSVPARCVQRGDEFSDGLGWHPVDEVEPGLGKAVWVVCEDGRQFSRHMDDNVIVRRDV